MSNVQIINDHYRDIVHSEVRDVLWGQVEHQFDPEVICYCEPCKLLLDAYWEVTLPEPWDMGLISRIRRWYVGNKNMRHWERKRLISFDEIFSRAQFESQRSLVYQELRDVMWNQGDHWNGDDCPCKPCSLLKEIFDHV